VKIWHKILIKEKSNVAAILRAEAHEY